MDVRTGYKQTGVGILPEDWDVKPLGSLGSVIRGASPRPKGDKRFYGGDVPRLMVEDVTRDKKFVTPRIDFLTVEGAKLSRPCKRGTLTVVCSGTPGVVGLPSFLAVDACIHDGMMALVNPSPRAVPDYLFHQLTSYQEKLYRSATHGGTFVNLTTAGFRAFEIALPPREAEQRAIADTLSDVDALLGGLDRLIAKKRDLKQAAMQQLLTGQTRLPGFHGEWQVKRLGEQVIRLRKTDHRSAAGRTEGRYPFFTNSTKPCNKYLDAFDFDTEAIIANTGGGAYFNYFNGPFAAMADCFVFESRAVTRFLYFVLKVNEQRINDTGFTGSGIRHLDKKYFSDFELRLPPTAGEQSALAALLSDMDTELTALEARRDKTRDLKQAMMQELLSGRTRLVPAVAAHA